MAVADWNQVKKNCAFSIIDEAGNHVFNFAITSFQYGFLLYKHKSDYMNAELILETKTIAGSDKIVSCAVFRSDAALDNGYLAGMKRESAGVYSIELRKWDAGVKSLLFAGGSFAINTEIWTKWRIRCWDVVFPIVNTRFTFEYWDGANWVLKYQRDDATRFLTGVSGYDGFGSYIEYSFAGTRHVRVDDLDLGHMV